MGRFIYICVFSFLTFSSFSAENAEFPYKQETVTNLTFQQTTDQIKEAISKGDAAGIAKFFDTSVDVNILGTDGTYSKSQAEQMLKTFFMKNKVQKFEVVHNTSTPSNRSNAFVGWLTANGKRYRLHVQLAASGTKSIIQDISIKER